MWSESTSRPGFSYTGLIQNLQATLGSPIKYHNESKRIKRRGTRTNEIKRYLTIAKTMEIIEIPMTISMVNLISNKTTGTIIGKEKTNLGRKGMMTRFTTFIID